MNKTDISRRNFLKGGALVGGGLLLSFTIPQSNRLTKLLSADAIEGFMPNAYLSIQTDNTVTVILSHVEMGQGIWTTLPMLLAEELDIDFKNVKVEHSPVGAPYNHTQYGIQITGGSSTTYTEFDRYRQAGAVAREMLKSAAAKKLNVDKSQLKTENGHVISGTNKLSYGDLANEASKIKAPENVQLRSAAEWKYIGKGQKRLDAAAKTNGTAVFGIDVNLDDLLVAVVAHPPVFGGKVKSFNSDKALTIPGVTQVVQIPNGVAVLASNYWSANEGKKVLDISWDLGKGAEYTTTEKIDEYKKLASTDGNSAAEKGNAKDGIEKAAKVIEAEYVFPYLAHAPMEPLNCTVKIDGDNCEIWTGTQMPGVDRDAAARILGFKPENVKMNTPFLGGGFGRRATTSSDFVSEAVHIAKESGKNIKMIWSREDDIQGGYYRPVYIHKVIAGVDETGKITAWHHNVVGQSIMMSTGFMPASPDAVDVTSVEGVSDSPYIVDLPDHFVGLHNTQEIFPPLWFRSVGHTHTGFVMETFIDELAANAKSDPYEFRKSMLSNHPRHLKALNLVAEKAGWSEALPEGHFRGIAVHESFKSFVAQVVEISMPDGKLKVHKVTCAIDCGIAVNPDGVKAQMESGIIFALTMALYGELTVKNGEIQEHNFYDYRMARMHESPEIEVHVVESTDEMGGAGECGVPPFAPALVNAIAAATGKRIYNLPLKNHNITTT
ncbi:isoquinoline 1-oxidoreductase, beta subunit [Flavobacteriaceae bacterium MAR_2010_188]|nr:isoquinoline 1-oxidoreductase, beta subunit [Flavobacteriaceae bacterium MAR_2010_188]